MWRTFSILWTLNEGIPVHRDGQSLQFHKGLDRDIGSEKRCHTLRQRRRGAFFNFNRTVRLNVPDNMRILKLPDLPVFRDFETIGPSGAHRADINGRGAAIEC